MMIVSVRKMTCARNSCGCRVSRVGLMGRVLRVCRVVWCGVVTRRGATHNGNERRPLVRLSLCLSACMHGPLPPNTNNGPVGRTDGRTDLVAVGEEEEGVEDELARVQAGVEDEVGEEPHPVLFGGVPCVFRRSTAAAG